MNVIENLWGSDVLLTNNKDLLNTHLGMKPLEDSCEGVDGPTEGVFGS